MCYICPCILPSNDLSITHSYEVGPLVVKTLAKNFAMSGYKEGRQDPMMAQLHSIVDQTAMAMAYLGSCLTALA